MPAIEMTCARSKFVVGEDIEEACDALVGIGFARLHLRKVSTQDFRGPKGANCFKGLLRRPCAPSHIEFRL